MTVTLPFSSTVTPSWSASRGWRRRGRRRGGAPASRANSPACGVNTVGAARPVTRSGCAARMVSPSASTITGRLLSSANHSAVAPVSSVPSPGPTAHACTRPTALALGAAMTSGQLESTCGTGASRVADHARGGGDGGAGAQHGRTGIGRRTGQDAGDTLGVLVVVGAGHRPAGGDVGGIESQSRRSVAARGRCRLTRPTAITKGVNGFQTAERHGHGGVHVRAVGGAGLHVDPLGMSTATTGCPRTTVANTSAALGRKGPEPEMPTTPSITKSVAAGTVFTHSAAGAGERGQRRLVGAFRGEEHRSGGRTSAAYERRSPQRVAAVVAGADDGADPAPGDAAGQPDQFADDRGGQSERSPSHQPAFGQRCQQWRFGFADLIGGVVVPHSSHDSMPATLTAPFQSPRVLL